MGIEINPSIRTIHRRADLYPDPGRFVPERFLGPDPPDTYTWLPFGGGTRRCLGASFALMEMRIVLDRVLERCVLAPVDAEPTTAQFRMITLAPKSGVRVRLARPPLPRPPIRLRPMLLYDSAISGNCYKVRLLFALLGIDYERRELSVFDRSDRPEMLGDLNPGLRVPTLVFDDGRSLGESGAILFHFARAPRTCRRTPSPAPRCCSGCSSSSTTSSPTSPSCASGRRPGPSHPEDEVQAKREGGEGALRALDRHLDGRSFLVGDAYSIADIALYAYTHVAPEGGFTLQPYPAVEAWLARVADQPGHIPIDN